MNDGAARGSDEAPGGDGARGARGAGLDGRPTSDREALCATAAGRPTARSRVRLVALDLDGVIYRGGMVLPGVREALENVVRRGLDLRYVSNNSTAHRETVSERLAGMGLPAGADRVFTSGYVAGRWLRSRLPAGTPVMVMGEEGLVRELREAGLAAYHVGEGSPEGTKQQAGGVSEPAEPEPTALAVALAPSADASSDDAPATLAPGAEALSADAPAAVVVGMDRSLSFRTLAEAQAAVRGGALFVATNPDPTFPTPDGLLPGAGALVAAVATAAETEPVFMGKPGQALAEIVAEVTGIPPRETLFVGDRLSTDIAMGLQAGMVTVLVLTGVTCEADLECARTGAGSALPDHVLADLRELPALLDSLGV